ncbi:MAG: ABC transporter ATP-binding protein [Chitinophagaceae bacterium]|nr:ABC transporter ATP-binding protein [Chitinophagaceae bacterium]
MIEAINLTKKYGDTIALDDLNLNVGGGEIFALLGQNGAGKTTTIHCFLGFIQQTSGAAYIHGMRVELNSSQTKQYLSYIPETVMLYPNLTGIENLHFFSSLAGFSYTNVELSRLLSRAGLQESAHRQRVADYSKGMRQKVGIAIAIAKNAKVLLLDEPTSGLDPKASNEFSEIIGAMAKKGTAILMATHDIFRAKEVSNRIGIMKAGNLVSVIDSKAISAKELDELYLQTV